MQLAFDAKQDIKRFFGVAGVSLALVVWTTSGAIAAPMDADRDGLTRGQEIRITETNPNDADTNNDGVRDGNEDDADEDDCDEIEDEDDEDDDDDGVPDDEDDEDDGDEDDE